jgi:hypothetical protein
MSVNRAALEPQPAMRRYLITRTFPPGALDAVDAAAKKKVNDNNRSVDVTWERSYVNGDRTKTFCIYNGPDEATIREAARRNGLPVDTVTEIPNILMPV